MRARGTDAADYAYRYDDKLHTVTSDFPTEGTMTNVYDGEGKLRSIVAGGSTQRLRWAGGTSPINEEDANGDLTMTFFGGATHVGADPVLFPVC